MLSAAFNPWHRGQGKQLVVQHRRTSEALLLAQMTVSGKECAGGLGAAEVVTTGGGLVAISPLQRPLSCGQGLRGESGGYLSVVPVKSGLSVCVQLKAGVFSRR
jgi:hypothetical protein